MARVSGRIKAVAYLRTSSASNVGTDKDSDKRQREAIRSFSERSGYDLVEEYYDAAVSGADPIETRPGFAALLDRIETNGVRTVIVEDASRFARDLVTQELGILLLIGRGVTVLTAAGDDLTNTSDPFKVAMRQIAGAFAQLEKSRLVSKLKVARERRRAAGEKCEGRKSHAELTPDVVALAKNLRRKPRKGERMSLRDIAAELARRGHVSANGTPFSPSVVRSMVQP
ncbi:recombinase family protein [Pleomorphomonas oryzae]|uniref:recombinase family protein n=1 Tax=Pleomorphomonas oryzae TaxID=261934 RepID=UPI00047DE204|nr:recombinase family protein [Pleomorphomonas oryzae]